MEFNVPVLEFNNYFKNISNIFSRNDTEDEPDRVVLNIQHASMDGFESYHRMKETDYMNVLNCLLSQENKFRNLRIIVRIGNAKIIVDYLNGSLELVSCPYVRFYERMFNYNDIVSILKTHNRLSKLERLHLDVASFDMDEEEGGTNEKYLKAILNDLLSPDHRFCNLEVGVSTENTEIRFNFSNNRLLKSVDCSDICINHKLFSIIFNALPAITQSDEHRELLLNRCTITSSDFNLIARMLKYQTKVTGLSLQNIVLENQCVSALASILSSPESNIRKIILKRNNITDDGAHDIFLCWKNNSSLQEVIFTCNFFGRKAAKELQLGCLKVLDLSYNGSNDTFVHSLDGVTRVLDDITHVSNEAVQNIALSLKDNKTLEELRLQYNKITDVGACKLADGLTINNTLVTLDLSGNNIGDTGCIAIGQSLRINKSLKVLVLKSNLIADEGSHSLSIALAVNNTLEVLYLQDNKIGDIGCISIATSLKTNHTLQTLGLSHNVIQDSGACSFASALVVNNTLIELDLEHCNIKDSGRLTLLEALKSNTTIQQLKLYYPRNEYMFEKILDMLNYNQTIWNSISWIGRFVTKIKNNNDYERIEKILYQNKWNHRVATKKVYFWLVTKWVRSTKKKKQTKKHFFGI